MTREQKLALIVGFSLILFVGVLISDHLSGSRRARTPKVEPEVAAAPVNVAPIQPPGPAPESHAASNTGSVDALRLIVPGPAPATAEPAPAVANNQPATAPVEPPATTPPTTEPTRIVQGSQNALMDEIERLGGQLIRGADGTTSFKLPPAAELSATPAQSPRPLINETRTPAPAPITTRAGPIEPLKTHIVRSGETLYQITSRYYGNGNLWRELARFNGLDRSGTLRLGAQIKLPPRDTLAGRSVAAGLEQSIDPGIKLIRPAPAKAPPPKAAPALQRDKARVELASYTVRQGDTLGEISLKTLGTSRRWQEIADLNKLDDEDAISAGTVLRIPARRS